jgi:hypothetical protein
MLVSTALLACLAPAAVVSAVPAASTAVADAPYIETVPFQFVYSTTFPRAPNWGVLPEPCCVGQLVAVLVSAADDNTTFAAAVAAADAAAAATATLLKFDSGSVYIAQRDGGASESVVRSGDAAAYTVKVVAVTGGGAGPLLSADATSRLLVVPGGPVVGVVSSKGVAPLLCSLARAAPACAGDAVTGFSFGAIVDVSFAGVADVNGGSGGGYSFLVASATGLYRVDVLAAVAAGLEGGGGGGGGGRGGGGRRGGGSGDVSGGGVGVGAVTVTTLRTEAGLTAVRMTPFSGSPPASSRTSGADTAFAAGQEYLYTFDARTGNVTHVEWIGKIATGSGGAVDGPVAAIAFDADAQRVLLGTY